MNNAKIIRIKISKLEDQIEALRDELFGMDDYHAVIPERFGSLTEFLHNHLFGEEYAICDNYEDAEQINMHKSKAAHHIVELTGLEVSVVQSEFDCDKLNNDFIRNHPDSYTSSSKLK